MDNFDVHSSPFATLHRHALVCDVCKVAGGYPYPVLCANGCSFVVYLCTPHFADAAMHGVDCCTVEETTDAFRFELFVGGVEVSH